MKKTTQGFTLIELLIVVVVIGLLASIAIPKFASTREKAFVSTAKTDLRNLANLQELYYNDNFSYGDMTAVGFTNSEGVIVNVTESHNLGWSATATHQGLPTVTCAIYHGSAAPVAPATVESAVQCND